MEPEKRRRQLLDSALDVIEADGYTGVSIEAIARRAGVTRPVVYGVFDGLGDLLFALLDRQERRALDQLTAALPEEGEMDDPDAYLVAAARRMIETVRTDPATWRPILLALEGTPPAVRRRIERDRGLVRAQVERLLVAGLERRGGPEIDPAVASHAILAVAEHFGKLIVEDPERFDATPLLATVERLLGALD